MTFSITARCPRTGMLGVAVSTAVPGVGGICPFIREGVGAVSTQSWVNPYLGIDGVELLGQGLSADEALQRLIEGDPGRDVRQLGLVDREGRSASFTGKDCVSWCGHVTGENFAAQGNMLSGDAVVPAMAEAFARANSLDLPERLIACLEAGQAMGDWAPNRPASRSSGKSPMPGWTSGSTSTAIRWRSCAASSRWPATSSCRSRPGCRPAPTRLAACPRA